MRDAEIDRFDLARSHRRKLHLQKRFDRKRQAREALEVDVKFMADKTKARR